MKKIEFVNRLTGEALTRSEALEQWRTEYDGGDDTNSVPFSEYYEEIN